VYVHADLAWLLDVGNLAYHVPYVDYIWCTLTECGWCHPSLDYYGDAFFTMLPLVTIGYRYGTVTYGTPKPNCLRIICSCSHEWHNHRLQWFLVLVFAQHRTLHFLVNALAVCLVRSFPQSGHVCRCALTHAEPCMECSFNSVVCVPFMWIVPHFMHICFLIQGVGTHFDRPPSPLVGQPGR
jgi:hypothetical protein